MTRKEAINTVRNIYQTDKEKEALEILIPELAESEDERIRKGLLEIFNKAQFGEWGKLKIKDIIAWLEKQKEQKPIFKKGDKVIWDDEEFNILDVNETEYNVGGYRVPFSRQNELHPIWQKPAEWSEDEKIRKELLKEIEFITPRDGETDGEGLILPSYHARIDRYKSYLEKQKEVKWSPSECEMGVLYKLCYVSNQITDEDDTELTRLYQDLKWEYFNGHSFENMFPKEKQKEQKPVVTHGETYHVDTLGTQQVIAGKMPQKPAEWSKEDERNMYNIIEAIKYTYDVSEGSGGWRLINYLKFRLRPQPHWKPSEDEERLINTSISFLKDFADKGYENAVECIDWLKSKLNGNTCE